MTEVAHVKVRNVLLLAIALLLAGGLTAYANATGSRISFNKYRSIASTVVDDKVYLELQETAEKLHAMVVWDKERKTPALYKPNIQIDTINKNNVVFGKVIREYDTKVDFVVRAHVDSLETKISAYRITISSPYDTDPESFDKLIHERTISDAGFQEGEYFVIREEMTYTFKYAGKYAIRVWMKPEGSDRYFVVGEKALYVT